MAQKGLMCKTIGVSKISCRYSGQPEPLGSIYKAVILSYYG